MPTLNAAGQMVDEDTGEVLSPEDMPENQDLSSAQVAGINQMPGAATSDVTLPMNLKDRIKKLTQMQQEELKKQQDMIKNQARNVANVASIPVQTDLRPAMNLVDQWTGSNLLKGYTPPQTGADKLAQISQLENTLMQRRNDLTKDQQSLLGSQIKQLMAEATQGRMDQRTDIMKQRLGLAQDTQAAKAADVFDKDSNLKTLVAQQQRIEVGKHTLESVPTLTPQLLNEIQMDIANAISGGRASAVSTQHALEFNSFQLEWDRFIQKMSNNPQDIGSPQVKQYIQDVLNRLGEAYQKNIQLRKDQLKTGRSYASNPAAQKTLEIKSAPEPSAPKGATGPAVGSIVNGYKFNGGDPNDQGSWEKQ